MDQVNVSRNQIEKELQELMTRETGLLRELLSSLQIEQQAILTNEADKVRSIQKEREPLVETLLGVREQRVNAIHQLVLACGIQVNTDTPITEEQCHEALDQCITPEQFGLAVIRDQMLALLEQLQAQTVRNNYLIVKKVSTTRQLIESLIPGENNKTYGDHGAIKKKKKTATATLINQEV